MLCNLLSVIIFLLVVVIIGLIIFKQKTNKSLESKDMFKDVELKDIELKEGFEGEVDSIGTAREIMKNNEIINNLLNDIQTKIPDVKINNYNPEIIYKNFQDNVANNIDIYGSAIISNISTDSETTAKAIDKLSANVSDMETIVNNMGLDNLKNKYYNRIKSLNNGMEIGLIRSPNTVYYNERTGSNSAAYLVTVNDGCLSVGATDYDIYKCDDKNPKQLFNMEHILNPVSYGNNIDTSLPIDTTNNLGKLNYPFALMKSVNNGNCLTNTNGLLTVQPCYTFQDQRWFPLE